MKTAMRKPTRTDARHEAAHAVVSVLLGLPLSRTDIRRRIIRDRSQAPSLKDGEELVSAGYTTLVEGSSVRWQRALPDPEARDCLERLALQIAAGCAAEARRGAKVSDVASQDDVYQLVLVAGILGIGTSNMEPAIRTWMGERVVIAEKVLHMDGGELWDRVTSTLLRKGALSGDEVRSLAAPTLKRVAAELERAAGAEGE